MNNEKKTNLDRREFMGRVLKAGLSSAAAAGLFWAFYDKTGPKANAGVGELVSFSDYSVPAKQGKTICITKGPDRTQTVRKAIDLLGGIERFIAPGDRVLIKPNVAFASPARLCATTNPALISEVVKLCYDRGKAKSVIVTDNPISNPSSCFTLSGIAKAASEAGAKIVLPKDYYFRNTTLKGAKLIKNWPVLYQPFKNIDKVIGISPVKDHERSLASMSMKNWYGLLGGARNVFHQDINTIIAELSMMIKPTMVILDGTEVMVSNGPTGGSVSDLQPMYKMIVSCDMVAADSYGAGLLGLEVNAVGYLLKAQNAGVGTTDFKSLKPIIE